MHSNSDPTVGKFDNYSPISSYDVSLWLISTQPAGCLPQILYWMRSHYTKELLVLISYGVDYTIITSLMGIILNVILSLLGDAARY